MSGGYCHVNKGNFYLGVGNVNLISDISILIVPAPAVWRLQMPRGQKIAVLFIFLLGSFVCIAPLVRIKVIVDLTKTMNISWAKSDVFIWSSVEPSVGIISGCLPTLRGLLMWAMQHCGLSGLLSGFKRSTHGNPGSDFNAITGEGDGHSRRSRNHSSLINSNGHRKLRPEDEACLTTVIATKGERSGSVRTGEISTSDSMKQHGGIRVHK
ncbi:hypothetical protein AJ79_08621 [Helicocarpus griseus UAMH5409]|uniref:Rhodopsin domain-containing protein n=1 Tax=Helicocarpus griseus UAMH5409 TaxID=1447875 RepID=A0A2B7WRM9_9EURO|nr:hypothetical protein AJ79_08621 [Helicocarpus griseus UAMH5409]